MFPKIADLAIGQKIYLHRQQRRKVGKDKYGDPIISAYTVVAFSKEKSLVQVRIGSRRFWKNEYELQRFCLEKQTAKGWL